MTFGSPLTPAELESRIDEGILVIDVRSAVEYAQGHVPGAVNIPLDSVQELLPELRQAADRRGLAVVCAAGPRSLTACAQLAGAGVEALSLAGGTTAWHAAGRPVSTSAEPGGRQVWAMDRQVRFTAGALVLGGLALGLRAPRARLLSVAIAGGLVYSAVSGTCGMASLLGRLPLNRTSPVALDSAREALRR
ncbi:rhodanese-like domain-containing protein [Streptomyces sp. NPDC087300]|uniref:rhodanese-like domain-containing protein n=1 Tax=Streptomyces sp. NPDC087300 TaxID=3365780 RepID=UPI0038089E6D